MHIYYRAYCDSFTNIAILGMAKLREKLNHQENRRIFKCKLVVPLILLRKCAISLELKGVSRLYPNIIGSILDIGLSYQKIYIYKNKIEYFHIDSNDEQEEMAVIWADSREILDKIIEIRKFQEGVQAGKGHGRWRSRLPEKVHNSHT